MIDECKNLCNLIADLEDWVQAALWLLEIIEMRLPRM